jgi:hypothetical protein
MFFILPDAPNLATCPRKELSFLIGSADSCFHKGWGKLYVAI